MGELGTGRDVVDVEVEVVEELESFFLFGFRFGHLVKMEVQGYIPSSSSVLNAHPEHTPTLQTSNPLLLIPDPVHQAMFPTLYVCKSDWTSVWWAGRIT